MTPPESKPEPAPDFIDTNDDSVPAPVRIALAGKHELFVDVLIDALIGSGTTAWWTPGNSTSEVLDHLQEQPADLVLLNSDPRGLPELTIDLTTQLEDGQLPVIVLGTGNEPDGLYPYMAAGALAVVDKSSADFDELAETIRIAVNGDPGTLREWHLKTSRQLRSADSQLRHRRAALATEPTARSGRSPTAVLSLSEIRTMLNRHFFGASLCRILLRPTVANRNPGRIYRFAKRTIDIAVSFILIVLLLPVLLVSALAVRFTSRGPIFYRQERYGRDGAEFSMIKFRSMVDGADRMLDDMNELARTGEVEVLDEMVFKAPDDPRITPVGRFLRRTTLDELPQLINVLAGHMSLVGPRPLVTDEIEALSDRVNEQRLAVRPGVTGVWQVTRSEETTFVERIALDLLYVERRSALLDASLLAMTPIAVARGARSH